MKTSAKKITGIFFLFLGLSPLVIMLSFNIARQIIRHKMKEKLKTENLQTIVVAEQDVVWMDKHEIWINGYMFDIHSKVLENGFYTFTGLYDEAETRLVEKNRDITKKNKSEHRFLTQIFNCLLNLFYSAPENYLSIPFCISTQSAFFTPRLEKPFCPEFTPPPQAACFFS